MLSDMLLQTKMMPPPQRPFLIPRPQLSQKLEQVTTVPLTLVSAPAGFGKTTLVANWVHEKTRDKKQNAEIMPAQMAWLSLDQQDNESDRFWQYFFAVLETAVSLPSSLAGQLKQPQPPPIPVLLTNLINQLTQQSDNLLLILDDMHLIETNTIHQHLAFLLENSPPTLHLILITRADPPLPLHRFRARGQMLEIRADELRFDQAETAAFLRQAVAPPLAAEDISLLAKQTEGWAVGLQLAALALPRHTADPHQFIQQLASSNRYILEYLTEEVLAQQPESVQSFLLQTAVLDQLCVPLCNAVTGRTDSQSILDDLAQRNLFITPIYPPQTAETARAESAEVAVFWYRYHHLFAALLKGHLRHQQPEQEPILHQRAAHWFAEQGNIETASTELVETAVFHAFTATDYALATTLIEEYASHIMMQGRARLLEAWLQQLTPEQQTAMPRANLAFAQALLLSGQISQVETYLRRAETSEQSAIDKTLEGQIQTLRAVLADTRGDAEAAQTLAQQAIENLAETDHVTRAMAHFALAGALRESGDVAAAIAQYEQAIPLCRAVQLLLLEMLARAHLCFLYLLRGQLHEAKAVATPVTAAEIQHPATAAVFAALGNVYLERYQLDEAEKWLQKSLTLAQQGGHNAAAIQAQIHDSRLQLAQGNFEEARQALDEAANLYQQGAPIWQDALLRHAQVRFWLAQNNISTAERMLAQAADPPPHLQDLLTLAQARIYLHESTPASLASARDILEPVIETAVSQQHHGITIEANLLLAQVLAAQNQPQAAHDHLEQVLALAQPEGYVLLFVEMGASVKTLLADSQSRYAKQLLQAFPQPSIVNQKFTIVEPLTERETEVLLLMTSGLTYQQIADDLVVSVNTVRHHVKGLYGKLGVNSRAQAVAKARTLGLD